CPSSGRQFGGGLRTGARIHSADDDAGDQGPRRGLAAGRRGPGRGSRDHRHRSVKLTKAFQAWYTAVNRDDAVGPLTIGQVNNAFLSEAAGAHGAALLNGAAGTAEVGGLSAFAVSYAREADETAGTLPA